MKQQHVAIAGGADLLVRSLLDRRQYHDPHGEAAAAGISPECWPLFGQICPSALKLADLMQNWELGSQRVLELGCGLGLASMVIHRRMGDITASDCHPLTQSFLYTNLLLNHLPDLKYRTGIWGRENHALGEFDLIIGSDLLYEQDHAALLAGFLAAHANPTCQVLLVDPGRSQCSQFSSLMAAQGYARTEWRLRLPERNTPFFPGRLFSFVRAHA